MFSGLGVVVNAYDLRYFQLLMDLSGHSTIVRQERSVRIWSLPSVPGTELLKPF